VYKTDPHTLEELRNNIRPEVSTIPGENPQRVNNNTFCGFIGCICQEGNSFGICCITGEFLPDLTKATLFLSSAAYFNSTIV
jgi:hypothetical protein